MTYYLKYRSRNFEEIDIESVRETLKKLFGSKNYPHALLFAGPKGTGKTSAARITAKVVNCINLKKDGKPCDKCDQCASITKGTNIDVIELDAASHRGIDDIRSLREAVKLSPISAKKKVYIIDEAHMLTTEASNAFLKTLEEPPDHVLFIFATTNPEKLIDTIRSRTTLVSFKKATTDEIIRSLGRIVKSEKLNIDKSALVVIAQRSDGSFRDAIKALEQLSVSRRKITSQNVEQLLEQSEVFDPEKFLTLLSQNDLKGCLTVIKNATESGVQTKSLYTKTIDRLHSSLMFQNGLSGQELGLFDTDQTIKLLTLLNDAYSKMASAYLESIPLEIVVVKWCEGKHIPEKTKPDLKKKEIKPVNTPNPETPTKTIMTDVSLNDIDAESWKQVREKVKSINFALDALLRASKPLGSLGSTIRLGVYYTFHKEHLERDANRRALEDVISEIFGQRIAVECVLCKPDGESVIAKADLVEPNNSLTNGSENDIIKAAREIFG